MKVNNVASRLVGQNNQKQQNFKGSMAQGAVDFIGKHPMGVAALAGSSVVAQKIVMSGSEALIGPVMDIGIGKAITKATDEKDERTNQSSKVQAIRTFSQSVGGTITGIAIRMACIGAATLGCAKAGEKIAQNIASKGDAGKDLLGFKDIANNKYLSQENASKWGKSIGGMAAVFIMLFTNFIIDAPFINVINDKTTKLVDKFTNKNKNNNAQKEVK